MIPEKDYLFRFITSLSKGNLWRCKVYCPLLKALFTIRASLKGVWPSLPGVCSRKLRFHPRCL